MNRRGFIGRLMAGACAAPVVIIGAGSTAAPVALISTGWMEEYERAVSRCSSLHLDHLGIHVSTSDAFSEHAARLGVAVDSLSDTQRSDGFRIAALSSVVRSQGGVLQVL